MTQIGGRVTSITAHSGNGMSGLAVDIECHISAGLPAVVIVGFANRALEEARERLRGAFVSSLLRLPRKRIIINLAPGDIPKHGTGFDVAMAVAILSTDGSVPRPPSDHCFIGELGLDGSVRPIRGIIGKLLAARELGLNTCYIPQGNLKQAQLIPGLQLYPLPDLQTLYLHLSHQAPLTPVASGQNLPSISPVAVTDFNEVVGQRSAKRALEIAAAGGHNVLLSGAPGSGKTMLARALPGILPPLNHEEMLEVTHLHSLASHKLGQIISNRPFRAPHHSASDAAIIGGGNPPHPGEISLSHKGVLFLDELPEFDRSAVEALRQPLEERCITVARSHHSTSYPADFILVATANPCPCGLANSKQPNQKCECKAYQVTKYQQRLSGPILDRIDLYVNVDAIEHNDLLGDSNSSESSAQIARRVARTHALQLNRSGLLNGRLPNRALKQIANLRPEAQDLLNKTAANVGLSARGYLRTLKVGRTIADLEGSPTIEANHVTEALQLRHTG